MRKKTPPVLPEIEEAATSSGKRLRRGPKPLLLAALTLMVLAAGGVSAVVLEIVPDPFSEPSQPVARRPAANAAPTPAPTKAPKPSSAEPVAAAKTVAQAPAAAGKLPPAAAAPAPTTAATPKPAAPVAATKAAAPEAAKPAAPSEAAGEEDSDATDNDQLVLLARRALADENAAGAEAFARRAIAKDPGDHHAMETLARALIDQDRGAEAVTYARRIVEKRRKRVPYRLLLGDALLMVGDAAGARKEWQAAAALEPGNREVKQRLQ
jgi:hypothetical protein